MAKRVKRLMIDELRRTFEGQKNLLLLDYQGTSAQDLNRVRLNLRRAGVRLMVIKNSLARRALDDLGKETLSEFLQGPSAVAFGQTDLVELVKSISEVTKASQAIRVRAGFAEGAVLTQQDVARLAALPSLEVLRAQVVCGIAGPVRGFLSVTSGLLRKWVSLLQALAEEKRKK